MKLTVRQITLMKLIDIYLFLFTNHLLIFVNENNGVMWQLLDPKQY